MSLKEVERSEDISLEKRADYFVVQTEQKTITKETYLSPRSASVNKNRLGCLYSTLGGIVFWPSGYLIGLVGFIEISCNGKDPDHLIAGLSEIALSGFVIKTGSDLINKGALSWRQQEIIDKFEKA